MSTTLLIDAKLYKTVDMWFNLVQINNTRIYGPYIYDFGLTLARLRVLK